MKGGIIMNYLEKYLLTENGDKKIRRNYEIDDSSYTELEKLSKKYHVTITDLVNISIKRLIETRYINVYKKDESEITLIHTIGMTVNNIKGLDYLKERYGISIYKLVNIAIRNALEEIDE